MAVYNIGRQGITPNTGTDNWTLAGSASESARVLAVSASGEVTTSAAMATRWARSTGQTGATTSITAAKAHINSPAALIESASSYATTQPTLDAGNLLVESWNAHGGIFYWHAGAPDEEWVLIGVATNVNISCRNATGTSTSSYTATWRED